MKKVASKVAHVNDLFQSLVFFLFFFFFLFCFANPVDSNLIQFESH